MELDLHIRIDIQTDWSDWLHPRIPETWTQLCCRNLSETTEKPSPAFKWCPPVFCIGLYNFNNPHEPTTGDLVPTLPCSKAMKGTTMGSDHGRYQTTVEVPSPWTFWTCHIIWFTRFTQSKLTNWGPPVNYVSHSTHSLVCEISP